MSVARPAVTIDRILVPFDFSEPSRVALGYALLFASWYGAQVTVSQVDSSTRDRPPLLSTEDIRERAAGVIGGAAVDMARIDVIAGRGDPVASLIREAHGLTSALLVVATHDRDDLDGGWPFSLVEDRILPAVNCPVLTVPATSVSAEPFERVLCAMDFSPAALSAFEYALSIGRKSNGRVSLVHVLAWARDNGASPIETRPDVARSRHLLEDQGEYLPQSRKRRMGTEFFGVACSLEYGRADETILSTAAAGRSDLIAIGAHGRSSCEPGPVGSTTRHILRHATCPVLTVPR